MKITISTNSQKPIGALIEDLIAQADDVFIASAYISRKAVEILLQRADLSRGANLKRVDILFGIDTEMERMVLECLLEARTQFPKAFHVRYTPSTSERLFHPKVYYFHCGQNSHIIVGSANLTHRGQFVNEEMYCHIECSSSDSLVNQLNTVRHAWLSAPFSAPLDDAILDYFRAIATGEVAKDAVSAILKKIGYLDPPPPPAPSAKECLLNELEKGYLISTDFSVAPLTVPVPIRHVPRQQGDNGNLVTVRTGLTASVQLLPPTACKDFALLYQKANGIVEQHSILLPLVPPGSFYVPLSAQIAFTTSMEPLLKQYKKLIGKYIFSEKPIDSHLTQLPARCTEEWRKHSHEPSIVSEEAFLQSARDRIAERRTEFSHEPQSAVRLIINSSPHPILYRAQKPNHPAWSLCDTKVDDDLLKTMLAILIEQVDMIIAATQKKQQPAVRQDLTRAKLLIAIRGKVIDSLLAKLSQIASKDWKTASKASKAKPSTPGKLMVIELDKLRKRAEEHRDKLEGWKNEKPQEAFEIILQQYSSIGLS